MKSFLIGYFVGWAILRTVQTGAHLAKNNAPEAAGAVIGAFSNAGLALAVYLYL